MTDEVFELFEVGDYDIRARRKGRKGRKREGVASSSRVSVFVVLRAGTREIKHSREGVGEIEAMDSAVRCALMELFPNAPLLLTDFFPMPAPFEAKSSPSELGLRGEALSVMRYTDGKNVFEGRADSVQTMHAIFMSVVGAFRAYLLHLRNEIPANLEQRASTLDTIPDLGSATHWNATPPPDTSSEVEPAA